MMALCLSLPIRDFKNDGNRVRFLPLAPSSSLLQLFVDQDEWKSRVFQIEPLLCMRFLLLEEGDQMKRKIVKLVQHAKRRLFMHWQKKNRLGSNDTDFLRRKYSTYFFLSTLILFLEYEWKIKCLVTKVVTNSELQTLQTIFIDQTIFFQLRH